MDNIAIFGDSGMAKDIEGCLIANKNEKNIIFINESDEKDLQSMNKDNYGFIMGIGNNKIRFKIYKKYPELNWINVISNRSIIAHDFKIGFGNYIGPGVVISPNILMGNHCIVNCNSFIGHDTVLKSFSQISPGVCIGGTGVEIGEGAFIGLNSTIINKPIKVGSWSSVGIGVSLSENVLPGAIYQSFNKILKFNDEKNN
jgi:UDP-3-O-[3-hydroxymyristoyl] glucosamine N-acyltransferase